MKIQSSIFTVFISIAWLSCACDKDAPEDPTPPKGVILRSVTISGVPSQNSQGHDWDSDGTGPDLLFTMDDNMGNWLFYSEVIPDADLTKSYSYDFEPDVRIDSIVNGQNKWELADDYDLLGPSYISGGFIYFFDWKYDQDSVVLKHQKPRVVLAVEYIY